MDFTKRTGLGVAQVAPMAQRLEPSEPPKPKALVAVILAGGLD